MRQRPARCVVYSEKDDNLASSVGPETRKIYAELCGVEGGRLKRVRKMEIACLP